MNINMTGFVESNTIIDMVEAVDIAAQSQLGFRVIGILFLMSVFIILVFRLLRDNPVPEVFATASGTCFFLSLLFGFMGWVPTASHIAFVVIFIASVIGIFTR